MWWLLRRVERALTRLPGVAEAGVNLATEKARVAYDPALVTTAQMQAAVEKAGYGVRAMPAEAAPVPAFSTAATTARLSASRASNPAGE